MTINDQSDPIQISVVHIILNKMSSSSPPPPIHTKEAAVGQHVAVDFGAEHGICHGKITLYFREEDFYHVAYADGEAADLTEAEYLAAAELATTTAGSPCAPMEYAPLHQYKGRGLVGMVGQFSLFPLPVSEHDKGPGIWRILEVLDPLDAACRGLVIADHERWDRGRPFFLCEGWEIADGKHGGGFGGACWTFHTEQSALEGETHLYSRMREVLRVPFCTAYFPASAALEEHVTVCSHTEIRRRNFFLDGNR